MMKDESETTMIDQNEDVDQGIQLGEISNENQPGLELDHHREITSYQIYKKYFTFSVSVLLLLVLILSASIVWLLFGMVPSSETTFYTQIKVKNILNHLQILQNIATSSNGSRSASFGFNQSAEYVYEKLAPFYKMSRQYFEISEWKEYENPQFKTNNKTFIYEKDFANFMYSGKGSISGFIFNVPNLGCDKSDFTNFEKGTIALIKRGTCTFKLKAQNALDSGATGVLIWNAEGPYIRGSLYSPINIPVFSVTNEVHSYILNITERPFVTMYSNTENVKVPTYNVIAESKKGNADEIVIVGSHLDSVEKGPGINDNGSGSMSSLEIALQMASVALENKVIFAFWAAEELGLLGSEYYVSKLSPEEKSKIKMNLNFDMIASPNYVRGVYNGQSAKNETIRGPSYKIQQIFENHYKSVELTFEMSDFDGRSDYGPFIENGIPAGGLDSGAEVLKTKKQRESFGGVEGKAFDPCYHLACDTIYNVNYLALEEASQCAGNAIFWFATKKELSKYLNEKP